MMQNDSTKLTLITETVKTPIGDLYLVADTDGILRAADFADCEPRLHKLLNRRLGNGAYHLSSGTAPKTIKHSLSAYFNGNLSAIDTIPVFCSGTVFQERVWHSLRAITAGSPIAYHDLAKRLGQPAATRAVGLANGANPFCIIIPCHRLVGSNGALTGYSGGIERKRWLLDHEAKRLR